MIEYKGYVGKVELDDEAGTLHGEVVGLRDVITFEGTTVPEVTLAFRESVDDYLAFCAERGEAPEKPFSGRFVVRIPPELHRQAYVHAKLKGESLNKWVEHVIEASLSDTGATSALARPRPAKAPRGRRASRAR